MEVVWAPDVHKAYVSLVYRVHSDKTLEWIVLFLHLPSAEQIHFLKMVSAQNV